MRPLLLAAVLAAAAGCGVQTREARAVQPNPARSLSSPEELPVSVKLYIHQRDMNLPHSYQLRSWAQFAVITRDRLRFHVGVVRAEEDEAETSRWRVWLEDETGKKYKPASREVPRMNRIHIGWGLFPYRPGDAWCREPPCLSKIIPGYTAYEGEADYVFYEPQLARRKKLSLVMRRGGLQYRYTWQFGEGMEVTHYGRTKVDDEMGTIVVPGPNTDLAGSRYENEKW
jgi:hypothetical protein